MPWVKYITDTLYESTTELVKSLKKIIPLTKSKNTDEHLRYIAAFSTMAVSVSVNMYMPYLASRYSESLGNPESQDGNSHAVQNTMALLVLYTLSSNAINILRNLTEYIIEPVIQRSSTELTANFLKKINGTDQQLFTRHTEGEILEKLSRARSSINNISFLMVHGIPSIVDFGVALSAIAQSGDAFPAMDVFLFIGLYMGFTTRYLSRLKQSEDAEMKASENVNDLLTTTLSNHDDISLLIDRETYKKRYDAILRDFDKAHNIKEGKNNILSIVQGFLATANILLFDVYNYSVFLNKTITISQYRMLSYLISQATYPLGMLISYYKVGRTTVRDMNNYYDILDDMPDNTRLTADPQINIDKGEIVFNQVSLSIQEESILSDITCKILPEQTTSIVGVNGSGKTSLTKLLVKTYSPTSGDIFIDGNNIKDICLDNYKNQMMIAPQKPTIFNDSLSFNIMRGSDISRENLLDIIKMCGLDSLLSMNADPDKIMLGKYGIKLSGGQQQLISLARILVYNPKIIIYDEAFSQVDNNTYNKILPILHKLNVGKTVIKIDHDINHAKDADVIFVMSHGKLAEAGTHNELIAIHDGLYLNLWQLQMQKTAVNEINSASTIASLEKYSMWKRNDTTKKDHAHVEVSDVMTKRTGRNPG